MRGNRWTHANTEVQQLEHGGAQGIGSRLRDLAQHEEDLHSGVYRYGIIQCAMCSIIEKAIDKERVALYHVNDLHCRYEAMLLHPYLVSGIEIQRWGDDSSNRHRATLHSPHPLSNVNYLECNNSQHETSEVERSLARTIAQQQISIHELPQVHSPRRFANPAYLICHLGHFEVFLRDCVGKPHPILVPLIWSHCVQDHPSQEKRMGFKVILIQYGVVHTNCRKQYE